MNERVAAAYQKALHALLCQQNVNGHWIGELSTSALSTATAVSALSLVQKHGSDPDAYRPLIHNGLIWLNAHQNADGGWGDTTRSISNISTSMLCRAAFHLAGAAPSHRDCLDKAELYVRAHCGHTTTDQAEAIRARYGRDRTFAIPILATSALAGLMPWSEVLPLPFELACVPQSWFRFLRLHVVSYALPALIAMGVAIHHHQRPRNPMTRVLRYLTRSRSLRVLQQIQPANGGFLEATPLTSFVTLSLASCGRANHPVTRKGAEFLLRSVRPDGSWPIDTNLATWVTTLSVNSLAAAGELSNLNHKAELCRWLSAQQYRSRHPYTGAPPGGWAWTDLPGGVPDADDTAGALLALSHLNVEDEERLALTAGVRWLVDLQNRDGGWPTFCRGWGHLPFDRSGPDLSAHAMRALLACTNTLRDKAVITRALQHGLRYMVQTQQADGSWLPLWFGNQYVKNDANPTYGTARVLAALRDLDMMTTGPARRGIAWLLTAQNPDGGWGGAAGVPSSMEESALAVEILFDAGPEARAAADRGVAWLVDRIDAGGLEDATPIGFYFARLWYFERLYPLIFTVAALGRACRLPTERRAPAPSA